jgi:hypothetical protein
MGAPPVVMGLVLGQDRPQVPFAEDEHPVGDLSPGGEHEPFRVSVRARASGRDLHYLDTGIGQDRVKRCGELPGPVTDQEPEVRGTITQIHQQVADLRAPIGWSGVSVTTSTAVVDDIACDGELLSRTGACVVPKLVRSR